MVSKDCSGLFSYGILAGANPTMAGGVLRVVDAMLFKVRHNRSKSKKFIMVSSPMPCVVIGLAGII